jgi:Flp pilus assembly pilin Flp
MARTLWAVFARMLSDDAGNALVEYAIVAAAIALPLIGISVAIANSSGVNLSNMTQHLSGLGTTPP